MNEKLLIRKVFETKYRVKDIVEDMTSAHLSKEDYIKLVGVFEESRRLVIK